MSDNGQNYSKDTSTSSANELKPSPDIQTAEWSEGVSVNTTPGPLKVDLSTSQHHHQHFHSQESEEDWEELEEYVEDSLEEYEEDSLEEYVEDSVEEYVEDSVEVNGTDSWAEKLEGLTTAFLSLLDNVWYYDPANSDGYQHSIPHLSRADDRSEGVSVNTRPCSMPVYCSTTHHHHQHDHHHHYQESGEDWEVEVNTRPDSLPVYCSTYHHHHQYFHHRYQESGEDWEVEVQWMPEGEEKICDVNAREEGVESRRDCQKEEGRDHSHQGVGRRLEGERAGGEREERAPPQH